MKNIDEVLTRRVAKVLPSRAALTRLMQSRNIRLYQGFDPTANRLHLGHTIGMRKLMDFAKLGHEVIFLFGTGTVLVGDPSERNTGRTLISQEEIDYNITTWKNQVSPIVDFDRVTIKQNGDWLTQLKLKEIINIASHISAVQLFKRDSFQRRIGQGDTVWYHETMYPLLQGYDSVVMDVDLEIGGTDQEFNMLIGRELQKKMNRHDKYVLTTPMVMGTDGQQMSKTSGNCIWLNDSPEDMYGKTMSIPDKLIPSYWQLLTDLPQKPSKELLKDPMNTKKRLALDITRQFHGHNKADSARLYFERTVQQKEIPPDTTDIVVKSNITILDTLKQTHKFSSGQIKRLIGQGGVELNGQKVSDPNQTIKTGIIKAGKRTYLKVTIENE